MLPAGPHGAVGPVAVAARASVVLKIPPSLPTNIVLLVVPL
jgi:hypothetical protein